MKKTMFEKPEVLVIKFDKCEDIVTCSGELIHEEPQPPHGPHGPGPINPPGPGPHSGPGPHHPGKP